ncbi:glycosyltransferase family 4 protein [Aliiglaciecola sp. 2_MG-2023]|uniref:glycosyltransferase family 4 protein n=1 Tax=unclassified Aliiglaciecola TaxID=2593648 RepID=UPI0026E21517|nr:MULTISPECIES: glycosyltransferase family 4 protein [unclassified Aliiglaciecola]MDO6709132.1 glycosyltransferase family 4 protein [Aliiglaciecola sp. 2_MG-2023]MDO6750280.1 glycosyltransferase family 4 protein [Aliiglaciecola sp. 1_MG-2023]
MSSLEGKRLLIVSHGHPDLNKGGAEMAAYNMFKENLNQGVDAYFLARTAQTPHGGAAFSQRNSSREILFHTTMDDGFLFSNIKTRHMWQEFRDLLLLIKPDVVHLHHYFLLGIEILEEIKRSLPNARVVLTLHEYLAICHNKGLMVKTSGKLCYQATARDCHSCFPEKQPGDFFLREQYIKRMFENVDYFVSPSAFLAKRYVEWGIDEQKISVIENGQNYFERNVVTNLNDSEFRAVRFAFFGQINPYKGIDVLIGALAGLSKNVKRQVMIEIHGANLEHQTGSYQEKVQELMKKYGARVHFHGAYEPQEMPSILASVDWAVVPSVWWENSPMVIQEAFNNGVPLIVSDIGGMQEKVRNGIDGLHFRHGSAFDLADKISLCVSDRSLRNTLAANINAPMSIQECVEKHLSLYE